MKTPHREEMASTIDVADAAARLGVCTRQIRNLTALGLPHEWHYKRRRILWPAAQRWFAEYREGLERARVARLANRALETSRHGSRHRRTVTNLARKKRVRAFVAGLPVATIRSLLVRSLLGDETTPSPATPDPAPPRSKRYNR